MPPTLPPVFVAAPHEGETVAHRLDNVRRACQLSRHAVSRGFAPLCMQPAIELGAYGENGEPVEAAALEAVGSLIDLAAAVEDGRLWVVEEVDGSLAEDVQAAWDLWTQMRDRSGFRRGYNTVRKPWESWCAAMVAQPTCKRGGREDD